MDRGAVASNHRDRGVSEDQQAFLLRVTMIANRRSSSEWVGSMSSARISLSPVTVWASPRRRRVCARCSPSSQGPKRIISLLLWNIRPGRRKRGLAHEGCAGGRAETIPSAAAFEAAIGLFPAPSGGSLRSPSGAALARGARPLAKAGAEQSEGSLAPRATVTGR